MALTPTPLYPWYGVVSGSELAQGDILLDCPVFAIPPMAVLRQERPWEVPFSSHNVILMTHTCDLAVRADGTTAVNEVALCPVYFRREMRDDALFRKSENWNSAKKGRFPSFHVLNQCGLPGHELDFMVVELRRVFSQRLPAVREFAAAQGERVRLLPPYREHLAQGFARFFMRLGLPVDIPDFK